jgi:WD40 repeat protein
MIKNENTIYQNICNICNNKKDLTTTTFTNCNHSICMNCFYKILIRNHIDVIRNVISSNSDSKNSKFKLKCVLCDNGSIKITSNEIWTNLKKSPLIYNEEKNMCVSHNKLIELYCLNCKMELCANCIEIHEEFLSKMSMTHTFAKNLLPEEHNCTIHTTEELKFYCVECNMIYCSICIIQNHKGHTVDHIKDYKAKLIERLKNIHFPYKPYDDFIAYINELETKIKDNLNIKFNSIIEEIENSISVLESLKCTIKKDSDLIEKNFSLLNEMLKMTYQKLYSDFKGDTSKLNTFNLRIMEKLISQMGYVTLNFSEYDSCLSQIKELDQKIIELNNKTEHNIYKIVNVEYGEENNNNLLNNNNNNSIDLQYDISAHEDIVTSLIKLNEDNLLASTSEDSSIKIWDVENNFNCVNILKGHGGAVNCLIQLKDGRLASASSDNTIKIWDRDKKNNSLFTTYKCTHSLTGHTQKILTLIELQEGQLVSGSMDSMIKIWDTMNNFKCTNTMSHEKGVLALIELPDKKIVSASEDHSIKVWDFRYFYYSNTKTISAHKDAVTCLTVFQNSYTNNMISNNNIVVCNNNKNNINSYCTPTPSNNSSSYITSNISSSNTFLISGSYDKSIKIWDTKNNFKCLFTLTDHMGFILNLIILQDGNLASSSSDGLIKIWDTKNNFNIIKNITIQSNKNLSRVKCLTQLKDGRLVSGYSDNMIKVWGKNKLKFILDV